MFSGQRFAILAMFCRKKLDGVRNILLFASAKCKLVSHSVRKVSDSVRKVSDGVGKVTYERCQMMP